MSRIEDLWASMREQGVAAQRRITAEHACDLYADFNPPDQVGLVAISTDRPPLPPQMRAISMERGERSDGRASLRLVLEHQMLLPVFAALCRDIVNSTAAGVGSERLASTVLDRLQRWRSLLERDSAGLPESTLRGLTGELAVLETRLLPAMLEREAVHAWRGPLGAAQDFLLSDGHRIEVKAIDRDADAITVNGLAQLDPGPDQLTLAIVRLQATGPTAEGAVTATRLIARVRDRLVADAEAVTMFDAALASLGWHEHPAHDEIAFRIVSIDAYDVQHSFPRLTPQNVPSGVQDATYIASLRDQPFQNWEMTK
jgi:hypothetical protein